MNTQTQNGSRYSEEDLGIFGAIIDEKLGIAREQLKIYKDQITDLGSNDDAGFKSLGESTTPFDAERLAGMAGRQQKLIIHLENAKLRVINKVYGVCRETGKLISKERLKAVPHATLSIEAKQRK
jgi:DnaK suppressor protein